MVASYLQYYQRNYAGRDWAAGQHHDIVWHYVNFGVHWTGCPKHSQSRGGSCFPLSFALLKSSHKVFCYVFIVVSFRLKDCLVQTKQRTTILSQSKEVHVRWLEHKVSPAFKKQPLKILFFPKAFTSLCIHSPEAVTTLFIGRLLHYAIRGFFADAFRWFCFRVPSFDYVRPRWRLLTGRLRLYQFPVSATNKLMLSSYLAIHFRVGWHEAWLCWWNQQSMPPVWKIQLLSCPSLAFFYANPALVLAIVFSP